MSAVERNSFARPPRSSSTAPVTGPQQRPRAGVDISSMSYVAVQQPASSHNLGRGHSPHNSSHPHRSCHSMVDMAPRSGAWIHEPYAPRYFPSPPEFAYSRHPPQAQTPSQPPNPGNSIRLPPASSLVSSTHNHGGSPHSGHLLPPPPHPPAPTGSSIRDLSFTLKTQHQHSDSYGTPSPAGSNPSPRMLSGSRPAAPTSDAYSQAPRRMIGDIRQLSPAHSSGSPAEEESRIRQLQQQQQLAKAAMQQHDRTQLEHGPPGGLSLNTRQLPPPPAQTLSSPASSKWSPVRQEGKLKIADLLLSDAPSEPLPLPQPPAGMPTPLSAPAIPSSSSRPPSAKTNRPTQRNPAAILEPGKGSYSIRVRQQPAAARSCGFGERDRRVIDPPPIVQLTVDDLDLGPEEESKFIRHPFSVVHCSIYDQTGSQDNSAMPEDYRQQRRLMGTLVASPFVGLDENGEEGCFFCFPDLSCRTPGAFRLKFSLVVLDPAQMVPGTTSPVRACALSDVFTVYNAKDFPGMKASTRLTKKLKEQGCLISIKKGNEKNNSSNSSNTRTRDESEDEDDGEGSNGGRRKRSRNN